jgi:hypothetical protein
VGWAQEWVIARAAEDAGLVAADQGIEHQQNRTNLRLALLVLSQSHKAVVLSNADQILDAIGAVVAGEVVWVELRE